MTTSPELSIHAVGDISLGDYNMALGFGVRSTIERKGCTYIFEEIGTFLGNADIVFGNLEGVLSDKGLDNNKYDSIVMRGAPEAVLGLRQAGFTILNVANNHMMQHGIEAFNDTCDLLRSNGIHPLGIKGSSEYSSCPVILPIKNKKIGFLGYALEHDRYSNNLGYAFGKRESILQDVCMLRQDVDLLVVSCHWGLELINRPSLHTISLARCMVDNGVDIILGHHPHVIQGIERYSDKLIVYSLGDFVFDLANPECNQSIILGINYDGKKINCTAYPIRINNRFQPYLLTGEERDRGIKKVNELSDKIPPDIHDITDEVIAEYYREYSRLIKRDKVYTIIKLIANIGKIEQRKLYMMVISKLKAKLGIGKTSLKQ